MLLKTFLLHIRTISTLPARVLRNCKTRHNAADSIFVVVVLLLFCNQLSLLATGFAITLASPWRQTARFLNWPGEINMAKEMSSSKMKPSLGEEARYQNLKHRSSSSSAVYSQMTATSLNSADDLHEPFSCLQTPMRSSQLWQCRLECRERRNGAPDSEHKHINIWFKGTTIR